MYRLPIVLLLLALALPGAAQAQTGAQGARVTQIDTSAYPNVTLYVSVTDASGATVGGLGQGDFTITEDGQPVTIDAFAGGGQSNISAALVFDRSGSMADAGKIEGARAAARAFVQQMRPGDQTSLIAFNEGLRTLQPFSGDTAALDRSIRQLSPDGGTALYDAVVAGVDSLANQPGRRALLVLSDGRDSRDDPDQRANFGSSNDLDQAIDYAREHGQPVYVIGLGERDAMGNSGIDEDVLQRIASESDGAYFYAPRADQLAQLYTQLAGNLQQEYRITYHSPRPFYDGTRRAIEVSVTGAAPTAGGYVERHMINVRSTPTVGLVLLGPIVAALLLPSLWLRRRGRGQPTPAPVGASAALPDPLPPAAALTMLEQGAARCSACDAALSSPDAAFCIACGATQHRAPAQHSRFCDQCGRPLRESARFCSGCGARAVTPQASG